MTPMEETKAYLRGLKVRAEEYNPESFRSLEKIWAELDSWLDEKAPEEPGGSYL